MKKWYKITGITNEMYEDWKGNLRKDIIVFKEHGEMQFRMLLNPFEAFAMRIQMIRTNLNNPCVLRLEKDVCNYFTEKKHAEEA